MNLNDQNLIIFLNGYIFVNYMNKICGYLCSLPKISGHPLLFVKKNGSY